MSISLKFVYTLAVPAAQIYRAFTNATALREWLCDTATVDPKPNGRFYVAWNSGYYASGEYVKLLPDREVTFIWSGRDDPAPSQVIVSIVTLGNGGCTLSLVQTGLENDATWAKARDEISHGWNEGLANLVSVLEDGPDLRITRRPMIGVMFGEFNSKVAAALEVPVTQGLRLDGVLNGLSAQKAGLQKDDVIVALGRQPVAEYNQVINLLQKHQTGDVVEVTYYRKGERKRVNMALTSRPMPPTPKTAAEFAEILDQRAREANQAMETALSGASEAEASFRPAPDAWCAKEVIAHLIHGERDAQAWLNEMVFSQERVSDGYGDNLPARIQATTAAYPTLETIRAELVNSQRETILLVVNLPAEFVANKASFWRATFNLLEYPFHTEDHVQQIHSAIQAARA